MTVEPLWVFASAGLCWLQLVSASMLHSRGWTVPGLLLAFGNREAMPDPDPMAARAKRAASNMVENLPLLLAVWVPAALVGGDPARIDQGAAIFFVARLAHFVLYVAGVAWLRTLAWAVSLGGLLWIGASVA